VKTKRLAAVAGILCLAVVCAGVAFADVSNTLVIEGQGYFEPIGGPELTANNANRDFEIFRGDTDFTPAQMHARIRATSEMDGDITSRITRECRRGDVLVVCPIRWQEWEMGNYTVTYQVQDTAGRQAIPITMSIVIWQFINIANGTSHGLALGSNGSVWTWGWNGSGQRGIASSVASAATFRAPTLIPQRRFNDLPVIDIAAAHHTSCVLNSAGIAHCWGSNSAGQLGDGGIFDSTMPWIVRMPSGVTFRQISGSKGDGARGAFGALGSNGDVYTWGFGGGFTLGTGSTSNQSRPTRITETGNIVYVSQGPSGGAAITDGGDVMVWGTNAHGQLARGNTTASNATTSRPSIVSGLPGNIRQVSYGGDGAFGFVMALTERGEVWGWGRARGVNGGAGNQTTPVRVGSISGVRFINAGADFTHMVVGNDVYGIGRANFGELFGGNTTTRTTPWLSSMADIAGNVGMTAGGFDNAYVLSVDGTTLWGIGVADATRQQFGSTIHQATSTAAARPWTITAPHVERQ